MRVICFLILVAVGVAIVAFAMQNNAEMTVHFFDFSFTLTVAQMAGLAYLLGMISGWTVVGLLRRSFVRVTETPEHAHSR